MAALLLLPLVSCAGGNAPGPGDIVVATRGERPDAAESRIVSIFGALGFHATTVQATRAVSARAPVFFGERAARSLGVRDAIRIGEAVREGSAVATEGRSLVAEALGVRFYRQGNIEVRGGRGDARYELEATWRSPAVLTKFLVDAPAVFKAPDGEPVVSAGRLGRGKFVYFGIPVVSSEGQVRFPGLGELLRHGLGMPSPALGRDGISAYFDPSLRRGVDADDLARLWAGRGIRSVHVAGWYGPDGYAYRELVTEIHRAGLRAYLWLEPPMVTRALWDAHPECREKTATGSEVTGEWRSLFALTEPACLELAVTAYEKMIDLAPWDGVDIAELYFENPAEGPDAPARYTPFHESVRRSFAESSGFDPMQLFDPGAQRFRSRDPSAMSAFEAYRTTLITKLHRDLLRALRPKLAEHDVVVTVIDSILDPAVARRVGQEPARIADLFRDYGFRVQVEDPFTTWSAEPERYTRLREAWGKHKAPYTVDINVVDRATPNPTVRMGGAELARAVAAAANGGEVTVYAESTVHDADWTTIRSALARPATVRPDGDGIRVSAPFAVNVRVPGSWPWATLDGAPTRAGSDGFFLVPPGEHRLARADAPSGPRVERTSCEVLSLRGGRMTVTSPSPCYLRVKADVPPRTTVDSTEVTRQWWISDGGMTLRVPAGRHTIALS